TYPFRGRVQRLQCPGFLEMQNRIELIRQPTAKIVTGSFCVGQVKHADRALEAGLSQGLCDITPQGQPKAVSVEARQNFLDAPGYTWAHPLTLGGSVPFRRRGDRALIGGEADQAAVVP